MADSTGKLDQGRQDRAGQDKAGQDKVGQDRAPRRHEMLQRVQIGLTGLAGVVLLVGLANIVIDKARLDERSMPPPVVPTLNSGDTNASAAPRDPLGELGVAPSAEQSGQVVPDLQPDPNLRKPMDRDPQQR